LKDLGDSKIGIVNVVDGKSFRIIRNDGVGHFIVMKNRATSGRTPNNRDMVTQTERKVCRLAWILVLSDRHGGTVPTVEANDGSGSTVALGKQEPSPVDVHVLLTGFGAVDQDYGAIQHARVLKEFFDINILLSLS
jgi:hypothetical protein